MNYIEQYKKCYQAILREHEEVFQRLDMEQLKAFMDAIIEAKRIFVHGTGREGISARGFAMRLAHLGKQTYWLFDDTTVGMGEGDLFIITDGRGDVGIHRRPAKPVHFLDLRPAQPGAGLQNGGEDCVSYLPSGGKSGKKICRSVSVRSCNSVYGGFSGRSQCTQTA